MPPAHAAVGLYTSHDASFNELQQDLSVLLLEALEVGNGASKHDKVLPGVLRVGLHPVLQVTWGRHKEGLHPTRLQRPLAPLITRQ